MPVRNGWPNIVVPGLPASSSGWPPKKTPYDLCSRCTSGEWSRPNYCAYLKCAPSNANSIDWKNGLVIKPPDASKTCEDCSKDKILGPLCVPLLCAQTPNTETKLLEPAMNAAAYRRSLELYRATSDLRLHNGDINRQQYRQAIENYRTDFKAINSR